MGNLFSVETPTVAQDQAARVGFRSETEAQHLRAAAHNYRMQAQACFEQSRVAWNCGNKQLAAQHKRNRLQLQKQADDCNGKAAEIIFERCNRGRGVNEVDLHGLYVKEALVYVEKRIVQAKAEGLDHLIIITGRGNHSENGIAKLKPALYNDLIQRHKLRCTLNKPNQGCIYVEFVRDGGFIGWLQDAGCCVM